MTTDLLENAIPHAVVEVTLHVPVSIPRLLLEETFETTALADVPARRWQAMINGEQDRLTDAIDEYLESQPDLQVEYDSTVSAPLPESFSTIRPEGLRYDGPAPSYLERVVFNTDGISLAAESPANNLSDEQARGALWALRQTWNLPGMNRRQKASLVRFLSELEHVCCSRPALHFFQPTSDDTCTFCGQIEAGHDVRSARKVNDVEAPEVQPREEEDAEG